MECDIECIQLNVTDWEQSFYNEGELSQTLVLADNNPIVFVAKPHAVIGSIATELTISRNAKAYLLDADGVEQLFHNGSEVDYSNEVVRTFVVRSQDGQWHRRYTVQIVHDQEQIVQTEPFDIDFDFNEGCYHLYGNNPNKNNYYVWEATGIQTELFAAGDTQWKNGNPGFRLANSSKAPMAYPTIPLIGGGPDGSDCLQLETKYAGKMGDDVGCPYASGSLFNGKFDAEKALKSKAEAMKATLFGVPFTHVPVALDVDLKLVSAGIAVHGNGQSFMDEPDIYCVIYDNDNGNFVLDGGNVLTSDRIKGIARLPHRYNGIYDQLSMDPIHGLELGKWQHYHLVVDYDPFNKASIDSSEESRNAQIDIEKLQNRGYSVVVGASSSWQGADFYCFQGQCLLIDNIKLTCVDLVAE